MIRPQHQAGLLPTLAPSLFLPGLRRAHVLDEPPLCFIRFESPGHSPAAGRTGTSSDEVVLPPR